MLLSAPGSKLTLGISGIAGQQERAFASFEDAILQLFATMMGDVQYDTFAAILGLGTVASRLAVTLLGAFCLCVLCIFRCRRT